MILSLLACLALYGGCAAREELPAPAPAPVKHQDILPVDPGEPEGRRLAKLYCQGCHLFAEPDLLDRRTLREYALPFLELRLGIPVGTGGLPPPRDEFRKPSDPVARRIVEAAGVFPDTALVAAEHWRQIVDYYLAVAPEEAIAPRPKVAVRQGLDLFAPLKSPYRPTAPFATLVKIAAGQIFVGQGVESSLAVLGADGQLQQQVRLPSAPVGLDLRPDAARVLMIGSVFPSDHPRGELMELKQVNGRYIAPGRRLLKGLSRPTHASYGALDGAGDEDIAVSEFGYLAGHLSWFAQGADGAYEEHVLHDVPGALSNRIHDFNGDGQADIAALMGQAAEGLYIHYGAGDGRFARSYEIQWPPSYGAAQMAMIDFDGDGDLDALTANGDNGDYPPLRQRYQGVRLYLNKDGFEEVFFYPLEGAYKAQAADFDLDGDLDIAAISFYADFERAPEEAFVYCVKRGRVDFAPAKLAEATHSRWLTMEAGDLDADGDVDLALGAYARAGSNVSEEIRDTWRRQSPGVMILRNRAGDGR